mgnify:CR=1 FL=1
MTYSIDIYVDWNTQDDTGLPWSLLSEAKDPTRIVAGAYVIAGHDEAIGVVEIVDVGTDGVVHLRAIPGTVAHNAHLLRARAS